MSSRPCESVAILYWLPNIAEKEFACPYSLLSLCRSLAHFFQG